MQNSLLGYVKGILHMVSESKSTCITITHANDVIVGNSASHGILLMLQLGADQRSRLMMATDRINQSGERIKESRRQLVETEDLGVHILQDLQLQHQTLLHTQQTVSTTFLSTLFRIMF